MYQNPIRALAMSVYREIFYHVVSQLLLPYLLTRGTSIKFSSVFTFFVFISLPKLYKWLVLDKERQ